MVSNPRAPELAIFDMDGLMFDTERLSLRAWDYAGKAAGYPVNSSVILEAVGMNAQGSARFFKERLGEDFPMEMLRKLKQQYMMEEIALKGTPVKDGLYDLLSFLEAKGVPKAVATSTGRVHTQLLLSSAGIADRFEHILCGDEVSEGKPNPEIFQRVAAHFGCAPETCIVLEDSENGILAASRANMVPLLIPDLKFPAPEIQKLAQKTFSSLMEVQVYLSTLY